MNTFGRNLRLTTFGESHGKAMGGIIDGFPPLFKIDFEALQEEIDKRKPGNSKLATQRKETDVPEFLSGINDEGITLGTPIGFIIRNADHHSQDYSELENKFRPNHADYTYEAKYGIKDHRGGGRASARETVNWVVAGALASQWLKSEYDISIWAELTGAGKVSFSDNVIEYFAKFPQSPEFHLSENQKELIFQEIANAKKDGDSIGGMVSCCISNLPPGIGNPIFDKLQARLAQAMMSINAAKSFEYGYGKKSSSCHGSEVLDNFFVNGDNIATKTNFSGGVQGGISNGLPIYFNVGFKPTPTIMKEVSTITKDLQETTLNMKGRHDPCVALRAVAVVKALAALVVADFLL